MKKKNLAFTLAEVLIVIGIIGVVAALTLPNLNHATGDKERITKVKKIYAALNEAFDRAQAIYGDYDTWFNDLEKDSQGHLVLATASKLVAMRVTEFLKISKICALEANKDCFAAGNSKYLSADDSTDYDGSTSIYKVVTADGMSLAFGLGYTGTAYPLSITVDIDGPNKGSYILGKDIFKFDVDNNQISPYYGGPSLFPSIVHGGLSAAKWILENDNTDYLKVDSTGKCNDSNIILDWTTNTSCH